MNKRRIPLSNVASGAEQGSTCIVAGRLLQISPATLAIEDETDRRSFGFRNSSPNLSRLRVGDILQLNLKFRNDAWRVEKYRVLVPCMLNNHVGRDWVQRWLEHGNRKRKNLILRDRINRAFRDFFHSQNFLEISTPLLVECPGMEPNLTGFQTEWRGPENIWRKKYFLPTSPEFQLKKMLVLGYERIFEFSRCFRNCEISSLHQPEFTMLEWYRAYKDYDVIMEDVEAAVYFAVNSVLGKDFLPFQGKMIAVKPPWKRVSIRELFVSAFGVDLDQVVNGADFAEQAIANGYDYVDAEDSFEDTFYKLFLTEIELKLGWDQPVIIYDYPIEMAALARRKPGEPRYCERFEVYIGGIELANGFGELNNVKEQAHRFDEFAMRSRGERDFHYEPDREFMEALGFGMPPSAGVALGFDRLVMLCAQESELDGVMALPHVEPPLEEDKP